MVKCFDFLFVKLMYLGPVSPFKIYLYNYLLMYVYTLFIFMSLPVCHSVCAVVRGICESLPMCHSVCAVVRGTCVSLPVCHGVCSGWRKCTGVVPSSYNMGPGYEVHVVSLRLYPILPIPNSCLGTIFGGYMVLLTLLVL